MTCRTTKDTSIRGLLGRLKQAVCNSTEGASSVSGIGIFDTIGERDVVISDEREIPYLAVVGTSMYIYNGPDTSDTEWTNTANWIAVESLYTGIAERTVGGITDGDSFTGETMQDMWDFLLKQEKFPVLTAPSSTFTASITGYREIGEIINIDFSSVFNRGSISPQYTATSPYRSGLPNNYVYTGTGLSNQASTALTDAQSITGHTVTSGNQSWTGRVAYDAGVQPKSSYGNDYSTPLAAGQTSAVTRTIIGVYPVFATTSSITTLTKQTLIANGNEISTVLVAETGGNKQKVDFPNTWGSITKLEQYNSLSNQWDVIDLSTFTVTSVIETVQGISVNYNRYTHNGSTIGERTLKWSV
jgi:hypothetical protein